jgi:flavin-dependent dehydrogenase
MSLDPDTKQLDVAILGGGLAGLTLARQLRRALPEASIEVFERAEERSYKVGESTVEIASSYLTRRLGLHEYMYDQQLPKNGLRFFFDTPQKDASLLDMSEIGTAGLPEFPSFQIDRARIEKDLIEMNRRANVPVHLGWAVRELELATRVDGDDEGARHTFVAERGKERQKVSAKWVCDAAGRASLIARKLGLRTEEGHEMAAVWARYRNVVDMDDLPMTHPDRAADADGKKYGAWRDRVRWTARYLSTNHMCYRGYWIWFIPLGRGITSVGWVGERAIFEDAMRKDEGFRRFLDGHRSSRDLMAGAELVDIGSYKQLAYGTKQFFGDRWACVGEAAAFSDPFYSPGSDYIAIENDLVTDMIVRDFRGEPASEQRQRREAYEELMHFRFRATVLLYQDLYPTLGSFDALLLKWNFDIACYYNLWLDPYLRDAHLDLREIRSTLRHKDKVLEVLRVYSRMFQRVVADLERTGRYHQNNLGKYNGAGDLMGFRAEIGRPRTQARILDTSIRIFHAVRESAEQLCGEEIGREAREVVASFDPRGPLAARVAF